MLFRKSKKLHRRIYHSKFFSWLKRILVFIFILACFAIVAWKSDLLKIKNIDCQFSNPEICQSIRVEIKEASLFNLNKNDIEEIIKQKFPQIKAIAFVKQFPKTVKVEIIERKPAAILTVKKIEQTTEQETIINNYFLVDIEGVVFLQTSEPQQNLPCFEIDQEISNQNNIRIGSNIPQVKIIAHLLKVGQNNEQIKLQKIILKPQEINLLINDNLEVLLSSDEKGITQINKLKIILDYYQDQGVNLKKVDLRFEKPVVIY